MIPTTVAEIKKKEKKKKTQKKDEDKKEKDGFHLKQKGMVSLQDSQRQVTTQVDRCQ